MKEQQCCNKTIVTINPRKLITVAIFHLTGIFTISYLNDKRKKLNKMLVK